MEYIVALGPHSTPLRQARIQWTKHMQKTVVHKPPEQAVAFRMIFITTFPLVGSTRKMFDPRRPSRQAVVTGSFSSLPKRVPSIVWCIRLNIPTLLCSASLIELCTLTLSRRRLECVRQSYVYTSCKLEAYPKLYNVNEKEKVCRLALSTGWG